MTSSPHLEPAHLRSRVPWTYRNEPPSRDRYAIGEPDARTDPAGPHRSAAWHRELGGDRIAGPGGTGARHAAGAGSVVGMDVQRCRVAVAHPGPGVDHAVVGHDVGLDHLGVVDGHAAAGRDRQFGALHGLRRAQAAEATRPERRLTSASQLNEGLAV